MSVRDPSPTCFIVVGKGAAAASLRNDGLECIFHTVETNLQGRRYEDFSEDR